MRKTLQTISVQLAAAFLEIQQFLAWKAGHCPDPGGEL